MCTGCRTLKSAIVKRVESSNTVKIFIDLVPADVALAASVMYTSSIGERRISLKRSSVDGSYVFTLRASIDGVYDALVVTIDFRSLSSSAKVRIMYSRFSARAESIAESMADLLSNLAEAIIAGRCEQAMRYASALLLGNGCR